MAFTNLDVSDFGTGFGMKDLPYELRVIERRRREERAKAKEKEQQSSGNRLNFVDYDDEKKEEIEEKRRAERAKLKEEQQQSTASGSNGNTSFKLEALISFINSAKLAIDDIKNDISQISLYAESMSNILIGDDSGLCEAWKTLKETADGLLEAFNSRAENFITVIENYYKESEQNSEEWKNKISKINEGFGEIQGFLKNRNS